VDERPESSNFLRTIIDADLASGKHTSVLTRFPPEPNGFLHIGHAKSIAVNFGLALSYGGACNLRFDDTNPVKEDETFETGIRNDVAWLGFEWADVFHASDYFERLYEFAEILINKGLAYVDDLSDEEIRVYRGTVTEAGKPGPYRDRSVADNLQRFRDMRAGKYDEGACVLRAKIDLANSNMKMRDPLLYRIRKVSHHRTGDDWCIYPFYDYAHGLSDAIEGITHSICTLEFDNNRELYDWILDQLPIGKPHPHQYEMARLSLAYTVMSKRHLLSLVTDGHVDGWDDPRMPTLAGFRRRGVTPEAIRNFADRVGVSKADNLVDLALLDHEIRADLNHRAKRVMCVLDPLEVVIDNWPEADEDDLDADYWPHDVPKEGSRKVRFSKRIFIERADFMEEPTKKFYRLAPGREVRLRYAYLVTCTGVDRDNNGEIIRLHCSYDPDSRGGNAPDGRKVKGTIHWVDAGSCLPAEVRLYGPLFTVERPGGPDWLSQVNPEARVIVHGKIEASVANEPVGTRYQFERKGYFVTDEDTTEGRLVYNRTVALRDSFKSKKKKKAPKAKANTNNAKKAENKPKTAALVDPVVAARAADIVSRHGLSHSDALVLAGDSDVISFYDDAVRTHDNAKSVANWVNNVLLAELKDSSIDALPFDGATFGSLVALVDGGTISGSAGKEVLAELLVSGGAPFAIVEARGLAQLSDEVKLREIVSRVLAENADHVEKFREGNKRLLGFFVGQVMKATSGKANPKLVQKILATELPE